MHNETQPAKIEPRLQLTKGLVIASPWISLILNGQKDWEMRGRSTDHRGWFALIWKGMGAIYGLAKLVNVGPPLNEDEMVANFERHRIPEQSIRAGEVAGWTTPWVLSDVIRLPRPVNYRHPPGAAPNDENVTIVTDADDFARDYLDAFEGLLTRAGREAGVAPVADTEAVRRRIELIRSLVLLASRKRSRPTSASYVRLRRR